MWVVFSFVITINTETLVEDDGVGGKCSCIIPKSDDNTFAV